MSNIQADVSPGDDFPLHHAVFSGDTKLVSQLIRVHDLAQKDVHECIMLLLSRGAPVKCL
ncbi:AN13C-like protein [Mya arenaria]|uniref:AN13C-like protein n=1 Tax=Mya arenaria TaxID=6604 RepID=A0ABY7FPA3_MYAAR|nr:AN13C-like protein [Mya arenaria]